VTTPHFIHLACHTEYSLVDGLIRIDELIDSAKKAKIPACVITDQSNLFALVKFYMKAQKAGIKPIIGSDLWLDADAPSQFILLCQNLQGYRNLTQLISKSYLEGQRDNIPYIKREWLLGKTEGLIAILGQTSDIGAALISGNQEFAKKNLAFWLNLFPQRLYFGLQRVGKPDEENYIYEAVMLAAAQNLPVVATNAVCFLHEDDFDAHEVRVCIRESSTLNDPRRPKKYTPQQYLRSPAEMVELFADIPEAIENTWYIAQRCNLQLTLGKNFLPDFPIPAGKTTEEYFCEQAQLGLAERLAQQNITSESQQQLYKDRLEQELKVILQMGFPGYFLIVADFIQWAKNHNIPVGPGRGSGAGSLVAYTLKITDLDPLPYDLLFERFLNPERVSMPDFDVDFCMIGRDDVINYVAERYGRDRVSQIITYGTMAAKAVVRDVGRVLGHPYGFVDQIAKLIPFELGITLDKALDDTPELQQRYETDEDVTTLIDMARKLEGLTRNVGTHAGGVVIAPSQLTDFSPLYCEEGSQDIVTQFDKDDIEKVGLVKFDFLGLRTLTIIKWALENINRYRDEPLDINKIPLDDKKAFDLLKRADTTAVFQLESDGLKELIKRLKPDCFEDIVALVALYRPGPLQSGMVDDFIDRKHGRAKIEYPHPELAPVLKPTYGVIVYQEQVMQIAQVLAGYTLGGADILRRCLSGSTQVIDSQTGNLVTLREIAADRDKWLGRRVFSLDLTTQQIVTCPILEIYPNGVREVWEVTTRTHRKIRATADHLFYTLLGWKPLQQFKAGDRIGLAKNLPISHSSSISDAQIKLIAYLIGDGHLSTKKITSCYFCNSDLRLITDFNNCVHRLFGRTAQVDQQAHPGHKSVFYVRVGWISGFNQWVDAHVLRAHSRDKEIPAWVYSLSTSQLQLFLGTLWSTDGSFDISIGHTDYNSTSAKLIEQIQHLLLRLGIVALFNVKKISYRGKPHISYRVQVTGREDFIKFYEQIQPFLSAEKAETAHVCYLKIQSKIKNYSKHTIPTEVIGIIATLKRQSGMSWAQIDQAVGGKPGSMSSGLNFQQSQRSLSRHRVLNFATVFKNQSLMAIANSEVFWDEIISIEPVGEEEVFDLSIPETHNFIANDFIVHNCMGKKNPEEMAMQRQVFVGGAENHGVKEQEASYIFDLMEKFAAYGFNKSHSAAYALVAYQTAWLKAHYPAAFMAAALSSDMDNTDKVVRLIDECRMMGLTIEPPHVNRSDYRFTVEKDKPLLVRYGLGAIKGAGENAIENIVEARHQKGDFQDLFDFCRRLDLKKVNRRVLEASLKAGALDKLAPSRAITLASFEKAIKLAEQHLSAKATGQNDMFGLSAATTQVEKPMFATNIAEWTLIETLQFEKDVLGFYISGHPIKQYQSELEQITSLRLGNIKPTEYKAVVRIAGWVVDLRHNQSKRGKMASLTLEDMTGQFEVVVYPDVYPAVKDLLAKDILLIAEGEVREDKFSGGRNMVANQLLTLEKIRETAKRLVLHITPEQANQETILGLKAAFEPHKTGKCPIHIMYQRPEVQVELILGQAWQVKINEELLSKLRQLLTMNNVRVIYS
jgi:DNA polymerase III subunit alpha